MGKHTPNTTEYSAPHPSTTPPDEGKTVVTSRQYDSTGSKVRHRSDHHYENDGSGIFEMASAMFSVITGGGKK